MSLQKSRQELSQIVKVTANVTAIWDGKSYDVSEGVEIQRGVAEFWQEKNPSISFTIEEVPIPPIPDRTTQNPLETNDRGVAFAGLKRGRKPKEGA